MSGYLTQNSILKCFNHHGFSVILFGILLLSILTTKAYSGAVGFGSKATGGTGGKQVTVTNAKDLKAEAEAAEAVIITVKGKIIHDVSGGDDDARIFVKSNKTIQGADANASVDANFNVVGANNVIFRNLSLSNADGKGTGDGIEFTKGCTNIWVDHCTFLQCKDGALDFKKACDNITVSWCEFAYTSASHKHNFANLIGHTDNNSTDEGKLKVTMHHNWYAKNVIERMPRVRYGQVHVFNNYYSSDRTKYVIGVGMKSQILLEASYFKNQGEKTWYDWGGGGKIQWTEDNIFAGNTVVSTWAENSTVFKPPYTYELDKTEDVPAIVMAGAGVPGQETHIFPIGDFQPFFNDNAIKKYQELNLQVLTWNFGLMKPPISTWLYTTTWERPGRMYWMASRVPVSTA